MHPQAAFERPSGATPPAEQVKSLLQDHLWSFLQLLWCESLFSCKVVVGSEQDDGGIKAGGGDQGEAISNQWRGVGYWSCICVWERSHGDGEFDRSFSGRLRTESRPKKGVTQ